MVGAEKNSPKPVLFLMQREPSISEIDDLDIVLEAVSRRRPSHLRAGLEARC